MADFVNPYHFIPLVGKCNRGNDAKDLMDKGDLNGWIDYTLETITPIFMPNSSNSMAFDVDKASNIRQPIENKEKDDFAERDKCSRYEFFCHEDFTKGVVDGYKPIIPGSEIRGVIRSAYETVTNSCMSTSDEKLPFYRRYGDYNSAGILRIKSDGSMYIQPCIRHTIKKYKLNKYKHAQEVWVSVDEISCNAKSGFQRGWLYVGEHFINKTREAVFIESKKDSFPVSEQMYNAYKTNLEIYADERVNKSSKHTGYKHLKPFVKDFDKALKDIKSGLLTSTEKHLLIYYDNSRNYLTPAVKSKRVFKKKLGNIAEDYMPCENIENCCPACSLFGMISDSGSISGRVRFQDLRSTGTDVLFEKPVVLPELASPKPSAFEFYLKRPDRVDFWDADKAIRHTSNRSYEEIRDYVPEISGRKFYWHHKSVDEKNFEKVMPSQRNVVVRPVKSGKKFAGRIYFNDLNKGELDRLMWVLTMGGSSEHGHKIGMGKPIGLGSVRLKVDNVSLRECAVTNNGISYGFMKFEAGEINELPNQAEFLNATQLQHEWQDKISYPYVDGSKGKEQFKWFANNKKGCRAGIGGNGDRPIISQDFTSRDMNKPLLSTVVQKKNEDCNNRHNNTNNRRDNSNNDSVDNDEEARKRRQELKQQAKKLNRFK